VLITNLQCLANTIVCICPQLYNRHG
jgi:hypothetical protein